MDNPITAQAQDAAAEINDFIDDQVNQLRQRLLRQCVGEEAIVQTAPGRTQAMVVQDVHVVYLFGALNVTLRGQDMDDEPFWARHDLVISISGAQNIPSSCKTS